MAEIFTGYHHRIFEGPAPFLVIEGKRVEYLALCQPGQESLTPILLLPAVFQDFRSLFFQSRFLLKKRPLLLLSLPDQGSNRDQAAEFNFIDMANLIGRFLEVNGIRRVLPVAFSYGAALGYAFNGIYPGKVERMVLGGLIHRMNEPFREFLIQARVLVERGDRDGFARRVMERMVNQRFRENSASHDPYPEKFQSYLRDLPREELNRYINNINRLIGIDRLPGTPGGTGFFYVGDQDHYTPPGLVRETAFTFDRGIFATIPGADHMIMMEQRTGLNQLVERFVIGQEPGEVPGLHLERIQTRSKKI